METKGHLSQQMFALMGVFAVCCFTVAVFMVPSILAKHLSVGALLAISIYSIIEVSLIFNICWNGLKVTQTIENGQVFQPGLVMRLKNIRQGFLWLTILKCLNFGAVPSIALIHIGFGIAAFSIDFNTLFLLGIVFFLEVICQIVIQGMGLKEDQDLTI